MKLLAVSALCVILLAPVAVAQTLSCPDPQDPTPTKARRDYVAPLAAGVSALHGSRFAEAVSLSDAAAPHAMDARQLQAALSLRSAALAAVEDDAQLVSTLETQLAVGCHSRVGEREAIAVQLEAARYRLQSQSQSQPQPQPQ